jgi:hypothetical protein
VTLPTWREVDVYLIFNGWRVVGAWEEQRWEVDPVEGRIKGPFRRKGSTEEFIRTFSAWRMDSLDDLLRDIRAVASA